MNKKVVILGGGVAGMTAAHELLVRGFNVEVYELSGTSEICQTDASVCR